jgi:opacity protein-like surface antigen
MRVRLSYVTPLLAAGAAALAISAAPIASAASPQLQPSCTEAVSGSECESPGNVEINDAPPPASFEPYGDEGFLIGGYGASDFHGGGLGFHGGGHR